MLLVLQALNIAIGLFRVLVGLMLGFEQDMFVVLARALDRELTLALDLGGIDSRCEQCSCEGDLNHFVNLINIVSDGSLFKLDAFR